ncbi:MAG: amino acid ABC transporter substrate-binding protein [Halioglobus sp.]
MRTLLLSLLPIFLMAQASWGANTIRVGTTQSLTGDFQQFGLEQLNGLQMWVDDINSRGALLGQTVELVHYDDESDPQRSALLYRQLIEQDKVDLLIGPYSSELTLAASEVSEKHQFPMVTAAASADLIWERGFDNIFGIDVPTSNYMDLAVITAAEQGSSTIAMIYADTEFSRDVAKGVRLRADKLGMRVVLDESYPADHKNEKDFSTLSVALKGANADVILGASYLEDSVAITRALNSHGVSAKMIAFTVGPALREFGDLLGEEATGIIGVVQWLRSIRMPTAQDFAYRYRSQHGNNPGVHAAIGYSAGQVIEAAVRLAGSTEHRAVHDQLHNMRFRSLLGHYEVDDAGRQIGKTNVLLQWQDDARRLVAPASLAERALIFPR